MTAKAPIGTEQLASLSPEQEAPVGNDGGFSYAEEIEQRQIAEYHDNVNLAVTPACEITGVPLIPHPDSPTPSGYCRPPDDHHPEHPRKHSELNDEGGLAVRHSRVLSMDHWLHHISVHQTFRGPELPVTPEGKFYRTIFNAAGLIPHQAIFLHEPGEYSLMDLDEEIRMYLWEKKLLRIERSGIVQVYLQNYVMNYAEQVIKPMHANKIIGAETPLELWQASKDVLKAAAVDVTRPIANRFESFYDKHLLPPTPDGNQRPKGYGHRKVAGFVMGKMVSNRDGEKANVCKIFRARLVALREGVSEPTAA